MISQKLFEYQKTFVPDIVLPPEPVSNVIMLPHKQTPYKEEIALEKGDVVVENVGHEAKMAALLAANQRIRHLGLNKPCFLAKTNNLNNLRFEDLFLFHEVRINPKEIFFAHDANKNSICFNILAFKVGDFLSCLKNQEPQILTNIDPFSVYKIPKIQVQNRFNGHGDYMQFMTAKGWAAE